MRIYALLETWSVLHLQQLLIEQLTDDWDVVVVKPLAITDLTLSQDLDDEDIVLRKKCVIKSTLSVSNAANHFYVIVSDSPILRGPLGLSYIALVLDNTIVDGTLDSERIESQVTNLIACIKEFIHSHPK